MATRVRHLSICMLVLLLSIIAVQAATGGIAAADSDFGMTSSVVYTVDPAASAVHITSTFVLSELKPDSKTGYYYFKAFSGYAEANVDNLTVTEGGKPVAFTTEASGKFQRLDVTFPTHLRYKKPQTVVFNYDLASSPPRTTGDASRVNAAYASFPVFAFGKANNSSVKVVAPASFTLDLQGDPLTRSTEGDTTVALAGDITDPDHFYAFVSARDDANLSPADLTVGTNQFQIRAWPGDAEWSTFVQQHVTSGVPQLEQLVGQPWPEAGRTTDVHEAYTPYLYGYAGWFDANKDTIEIGEDLDDNVVYHELSHAWFNDSLFSDRWINEGLAQEYANRTVSGLGGTLATPNPIDPTASGALSLSAWSNPTSDHADAAEAFGYNASWRVIRTITDEIGIDKMKLVIAAAVQRTPAYGPSQGSDQPAQASDWKRFLDLVDTLGGATKADDAFTNYVVTTDARTVLQTRSAARTAYAALAASESAAAAGGTWTTPPVVLQSMESWTFDRATTAMTQATAILDLVKQIAAVSIDGQVPDFASIHDGYEAATTTAQLDAVASAAHTQLDERTKTAAAIAAKIAADKAAAEAKLAADTAAAKQALATAVDARQHANGLFDSLGLWGSDVDTHVAAAQRAMDAGQLDVVQTESAMASRQLAEATSTGQRRLGLAGAGLLAVIGGLLGATLMLRRRRRRSTSAPASEPSSTPATSPAGDAVWAAPGDEESATIVVPDTAASGDLPTEPGALLDEGDVTEPRAERAPEHAQD